MRVGSPSIGEPKLEMRDLPKLELLEGEKTSAPGIAGSLAQEHLAVLLSTIGTQLGRGSLAFYRRTFDISTVEWRLLMTLAIIDALNVSELSEAALIDKAAASRGLVVLQARKLIAVEQTRSRGRAAIVRLTAEGRAFIARLKEVASERDARLFKSFSKRDKDSLRSLLMKLAKALDDTAWDR